MRLGRHDGAGARDIFTFDEAVCERLGVSAHGGDGCAQLVGDREQELPLTPFRHRESRRESIERFGHVSHLGGPLRTDVDAALTPAQAQGSVSRAAQGCREPGARDQRNRDGNGQSDDESDEKPRDELGRRAARHRQGLHENHPEARLEGPADYEDRARRCLGLGLHSRARRDSGNLVGGHALGEFLRAWTHHIGGHLLGLEHPCHAWREDIASLGIDAQGRGREIREASELGGGERLGVAADEGQ